jgi:tetratricopeptide (TPR) repeat protein
VPLDWAATQNNLGTALRTLGARESGTARLTEAVTAYRAALTEQTRERVPLDWARIQNNLGTALWALGAREGDAARLTEALQAVRLAWEVYLAAGYEHYRDDFEKRIHGLEAAIADASRETPRS